MAATGSGSGPDKIGYILGITKAYTTRVGSGPFPTELKNQIGENLGKRGKEFGTVTARKRRCGWFDGVLVRQTIKISGINGIALTKLDVLDELDEIKICIGYELNGKKLMSMFKNIKSFFKTSITFIISFIVATFNVIFIIFLNNSVVRTIIFFTNINFCARIVFFYMSG